MKAAVYLRVSTQQQDENTQLPDLKKKMEKDGAEFIPNGIFKDKMSGLEDNREGLNALLKLTKEDVDIIYIWEISRLSRNPEKFNSLISHFKSKGINVCFLKPQPLYLFNIETGEEEFTNALALSLFSTFSLWEIKQKNLRMQRGRREKIESGHTPYASTPPYGYCIKEGKICINDETEISNLEGFKTEKEVVESIYRLYLNGKTMMQIKQLLNEYKLPSPLSRQAVNGVIKYKKRNRGIVLKKGELLWTKSSINMILTNTAYYGHKEVKLKFPTERTERKEINGEMKNIPVYNHETIEIELPPIIEEATFLAVQDKKSQNVYNAPKNYKHQYLLRGLLKCGECGSYYQGSATAMKNGKLPYADIYRCADRARKYHDNTKIGCKNVTVYAKRLDEMVWTATQQFYVRYKKHEIKTVGVEGLKHNIDEIEKLISLKTLHIGDLDKKLDNLASRLALVSDSMAKRIIAGSEKLEDEKLKLEKEIESLKHEIASIQNSIEKINAAAETDWKIEDISSHFDLKKDALMKLVKEITVYKYDRNAVVFQIEYNILDGVTSVPIKLDILYNSRKHIYFWIVEHEGMRFNPENLNFRIKTYPNTNNLHKFSFNSGYMYYSPKEIMEEYRDEWIKTVPVYEMD